MQMSVTLELDEQALANLPFGPGECIRLLVVFLKEQKL